MPQCGTCHPFAGEWRSKAGAYRPRNGLSAVGSEHNVGRFRGPARNAFLEASLRRNSLPSGLNSGVGGAAGSSKFLFYKPCHFLSRRNWL